jgi:hypothetical protein
MMVRRDKKQFVFGLDERNGDVYENTEDGKTAGEGTNVNAGNLGTKGYMQRQRKCKGNGRIFVKFVKFSKKLKCLRIQ